jgi:hypothetical protein
MGVDVEKLMNGKSDEDLQKYLDNRMDYTPEAVVSAIAEMQKRGRTFSDEELTGIRNEMQLKRTTEEVGKKGMWNKNVVTDKAAPSYYSEKAIYLFGTFFSVLFGAVLLAINIKNTELKKGVWPVLAFGVIYTVLQIWILTELQVNSSSGAYLFSMVGTLLMNYLFWRKYIGKDTKYRTRPIWKPLIIAIVIFTPLIFAAIYGGA